ncbi:MAG: c-type cytochrome [Longimicrobiales bacterium]|nr:c-type cytochrome [Longimicrobiales bacterium]
MSKPCGGLRRLVLLAVASGCVSGSAAAQESVDVAYAEQLLSQLACGTCHGGIQVQSAIREVAPDLTDAGLRLNPDYVMGFLQHPVRVRAFIGLSRMPDFRLDERESLALTLFLAEQVPRGRARPDFVLQTTPRAASRYPEVTARLGEEIFYSLNCGACHVQRTVPEWVEKSAPDLSEVGARVTPEWLESFLLTPEAVRPFGYRPGSGSRHPDFRLTESEAKAIAGYFRPREAVDSASSFEPQRLHPFSMNKAESLLKDKLPCLGCHSLGGEGGSIGPDLSSVRNRLRPDYVYRVVRDPQRVVPGTVMPKVEMPDETLNLIVSYLLQQQVPRDRISYPSLVDTPPYVQREPDGVEGSYVRYCAPCHGREGRGDGFNAARLPKPPTNHADSAYMSTRPDDTLFDGIYAGGYILGRSNRMPPWGFTLEREEIRRLVRYLRQLCRCEPPAWSRNPR